ncbi:hypothetical protein KCV03_g268, partial [Aureobasidium melanogenum]
LTLFLSAFCIRLPLVPQNHVCCTQLYDSHQTHLFIVKPPVNQYLINCPAQSSSRRISSLNNLQADLASKQARAFRYSKTRSNSKRLEHLPELGR